MTDPNKAAVLPDGYSITESGAPRGERRWWHLYGPDGVMVDESTNRKKLIDVALADAARRLK